MICKKPLNIFVGPKGAEESVGGGRGEGGSEVWARFFFEKSIELIKVHGGISICPVIIYGHCEVTPINVLSLKNTTLLMVNLIDF